MIWFWAGYLYFMLVLVGAGLTLYRQRHLGNYFHEADDADDVVNWVLAVTLLMPLCFYFFFKERSK